MICLPTPSKKKLLAGGAKSALLSGRIVSKKKINKKSQESLVIEVNDEDEDDDPNANILEGFSRREKKNLIKKLNQTYEMASNVYARQVRMMERINDIEKHIEKIAKVFK